MENGFKVHVCGITKNEYMAAARWLSLNKIVPIAILAVAAAICLVVFGSGDPALLLFPVVAIGFALVYYEMINLRDYKKFPADLQMDYEIDSRGWRLYVMDTTGLCAWANTVRMRENNDVFLLYNAKNTSNLLPKRCMTSEQILQVREWYANRFHLEGFQEDSKDEGRGEDEDHGGDEDRSEDEKDELQ